MAWALVPLLLAEAPREASARREKAETVQALAEKAGLPYPIPRLFLRAHKQERELEVWGSASMTKPFRLVATYPIAGMSGRLGPKRREGDLQVPEGIYFIDRFNPRSSFHLSLGLNYPNASDRILSDRLRPGSDIFIHGSTASIGCLAMTDDKIKEIYLMALDARGKGQRRIPVHIFPFRMEGETWRRAGIQPEPLRLFWGSLRPLWLAFERSRLVPRSSVDPKTGRYRLR